MSNFGFDGRYDHLCDIVDKELASPESAFILFGGNKLLAVVPDWDRVCTLIDALTPTGDYQVLTILDTLNETFIDVFVEDGEKDG